MARLTLMWLVLFGALLSGCFADRRGVRRQDGGGSPGGDADLQLDGGTSTVPPDAGDTEPPVPPADGGVDAAAPPAVDGGPPPAPDAGSPPLRSCDALYGSLRGYDLCDERATECHVYLNPLGNDTCTNLCAAGGGTCIDGYEEAGLSRCPEGEPASGHGCDDRRNDQVCVCTREP